MRPCWCVLDREGLWHATFRGHGPDPGAWSDRVACGGYVALRHAHGRRLPTCPGCLARVRRRRENRRR